MPEIQLHAFLFDSSGGFVAGVVFTLVGMFIWNTYQRIEERRKEDK